MIQTIKQFILMGGYGGYVFSAYLCVLGLLTAQGYASWRRWHRYLKKEKRST